jgi:DNA phosphorothioation-dependent restriction protein DptG
MNNRIKMADSKFKCNIFLFLSVTVFMARLSILIEQQNGFRQNRSIVIATYNFLYIVYSRMDIR